MAAVEFKLRVDRATGEKVLVVSYISADGTSRDMHEFQHDLILENVFDLPALEDGVATGTIDITRERRT